MNVLYSIKHQNDLNFHYKFQLSIFYSGQENQLENVKVVLKQSDCQGYFMLYNNGNVHKKFQVFIFYISRENRVLPKTFQMHIPTDNSNYRVALFLKKSKEILIRIITQNPLKTSK